jgi:hypothetical protein
MPNDIQIGTITTPNPTLWLNMDTVGLDTVKYLISTPSPGASWIMVNQFCSVLSVSWLSGGRGNNPYGLSNLSNAEKVAMAGVLISFNSLDDQVAYAEERLNGRRETQQRVLDGVQRAGFRPNTRIWAGNDFHVVALFIVDDRFYDLYDPNTGQTTRHERARFNELMTASGWTAFVVS